MAYKVTNPLMCTKGEADYVLEKMQELLDKNGYVTLKNVYDMVLMLPEYRGKMDHAYGYIDLKMAGVEHNDHEGVYEVLLPAPVAL